MEYVCVSGNLPHPQDAVLGGGFASPPGGLVLGGLAGAVQRLQHLAPAQRIAALQQLMTYGADGVSAIAQALNDPSLDVQRVAYFLLNESSLAIAQTAVQDYCPYALFGLRGVLRGHRQGITAVALSPDEQTVVSSSRDRTVQVWDLDAQEAFLTFTAPFFVSTLTISPDSRAVVLRDVDRQLRVWSLRNGQELPLDVLQDWGMEGGDRTESPPSGTDGVNQLSQGWLDESVQWENPDWLGSYRESADQTVSKPPMAEASDRLKPRAIASTALHRDRYLISSSQAKIRVWDLQRGREMAVLRGHTSLVTAIAAAPSGQWIISGSEDCTVGVWGIP